MLLWSYMVFCRSNRNPTTRATEPPSRPRSLYLAQAHLFLIEKIPLPLVGLISALITATSRAVIIPRGQAGVNGKGPGSLVPTEATCWDSDAPAQH